MQNIWALRETRVGWAWAFWFSSLTSTDVDCVCPGDGSPVPGHRLTLHSEARDKQRSKRSRGRNSEGEDKAVRAEVVRRKSWLPGRPPSDSGSGTGHLPLINSLPCLHQLIRIWFMSLGFSSPRKQTVLGLNSFCMSIWPFPTWGKVSLVEKRCCRKECWWVVPSLP